MFNTPQRPLRWPLALAALTVLAGCGDELGECNEAAARELVYNGQYVATKGQALMHASCGSGAVCHSQAAKGTQREGAPGALNFDMLPIPVGLAGTLEHRDGIWRTIEEGTMPPPGFRVLSSGWSYDPTLQNGSPQLSSLSTREGKATLRNWLACGAPVVTDAVTPLWAQPATVRPEDATWDRVYSELQSCALATCHGDSRAEGGLNFADSCNAARALREPGACGAPRVLPGDGAGSLIIAKLERGTAASCPGPMPPTGPLWSEKRIALLKIWIDAGAKADACGL